MNLATPLNSKKIIEKGKIFNLVPDMKKKFVLLLGLSFLLNAYLGNEIRIKNQKLQTYDEENKLLVLYNENSNLKLDSCERNIEIRELGSDINKLRLEMTYETKEIIDGIKIKINKWDYTQYRNKLRPPKDKWPSMITESLKDPYIEELNNQIKKKFGEKYHIHNIIRFIQLFAYENDILTGLNEYPKYPIETLFDLGGDCEDTSILLATFLMHNGFGTLLLELPHHMAVAVRCEDDDPKAYFRYKGNSYMYIETTDKTEVGYVPEEFKNKDPKIIEIE